MPSRPPLRRAIHTCFRRQPLLMIGGSSAVLLLGLILGVVTSDSVQQRANAYSDVPSESSAAAAIGEMTRLGLLRGYENGLFGPDDPVTRSQIAILLTRLRDRDLRALRAQVEEMRATLELGTCGDGIAQTGEECDDGNVITGDGCSSECLREVLREGCPGNRRIGEEYPAPDGCNTCICTEHGVICTKMHCAAPEELPPEAPPPNIAVSSTPPSDAAPVCGNGRCEWNENTLPPHRRFYCPEDCTGEPRQSQCGNLTQEFHELAAAWRACQSDKDCEELEQSCPYLTCGTAVNKSNYPKLSLKRDVLTDTCRREGDIKECVTCPPSAALCRDGQCVIVQEKR